MRDDIVARPALGIAAQQVLGAKDQLAPPSPVERDFQSSLVERDQGQQRAEIAGLPPVVHERFGECDVAAGKDVAAELPIAKREIDFAVERSHGSAWSEAPGDPVGRGQGQGSEIHALEQGKQNARGGRQ